MASRHELRDEFYEVLGSRNVYFQPPASVNMNYPCIRYSLSGYDARHANNLVYRMTKRYDGVVIDYDPDSTIPDQMLARFPMCSFSKPYVSNNLHHFPFTIYH